MNAQTHYSTGRHIHHAVFDWRSLKRELSGHEFLFQDSRTNEESDVLSEKPINKEETNIPGLQTKQLDYLYWQLDSLKQNMKEKQSCLANVSIKLYNIIN